MQRLHEHDLTGHLLAKGGWHHLCLPAIAEERTEYSFGAVTKSREAGALLHEAREGAAEIARAKHELGSYCFATQYQQRPAPLGGGLIKPGWFRRYRTPPAAPKLIVQSWDTAHKSGVDNDPSVCGTFAETEGGFALVDIYRAKLDFPDLTRAALSLAQRDHPHAILIEDKASGQSLIQELKRETTLPVVGIRPVGDKLSRMAAASAAIYPTTIRVDQGTEFVSRDLDLWAYTKGVVLDFSRPGKPTDNAFIEAFNGRFRAECLNQHWFMSHEDAREKMEGWRKYYNEERPHGAIGQKAPVNLLDHDGVPSQPS